MRHRSGGTGWGGFCGEVLRVAMTNCFSSFRGRHPVECLGSKDYPVPYGPGEKYVIPQADDVVAAVKRILD